MFKKLAVIAIAAMIALVALTGCGAEEEKTEGVYELTCVVTDVNFFSGDVEIERADGHVFEMKHDQNVNTFPHIDDVVVIEFYDNGTPDNVVDDIVISGTYVNR